MKYPVYLYKMIRSIPAFADKREQVTGEYIRRVELPIPPFIGLCICTRNIEEEDVIEKVWITPRGAVICEIHQKVWVIGENNCDVAAEEWPRLLAYETEGWTELQDFEDLAP